MKTNKTLRDLELNTRALRILRAASIDTLNELLNLKECELAHITGMGIHTANSIVEAVRSHGLSFLDPAYRVKWYGHPRLESRIEALRVPILTLNALHKAKLFRICDLLVLSEGEFFDTPYIGSENFRIVKTQVKRGLIFEEHGQRYVHQLNFRRPGELNLRWQCVISAFKK